MNGRAFDLSTRATTRRAAEEQLKRFEAPPPAQRPGGADPFYLDADVAADSGQLRHSVATRAISAGADALSYPRT